MNPLYIVPKKKCPLYIYVNFYQTIAVFFIQLFCFKKCDYVTMLCAIKKFIQCIFTATTNCHKHEYPNYESHKINISRVFHLHYSPQHVHVSLNKSVAELLWVPGVVLAVRTTGVSLSHKCDITKCRSQPWVVTRRHLVLLESFVTSLALNLLLSHLEVLDVVLSYLDIWTLRIMACSMPTAR